MATLTDNVQNFREGPATLQITPYDSAGSLEANSVIIYYAKDGVSLTLGETWRDRGADSVPIKIGKVLEGIEIKGSAIVQDMDPELMHAFMGGTLTEDGTDTTKKRLELTTTDPFKLQYGAQVEIIDNANTDLVTLVVKAEVFVSSLTLDQSMKKDMTYQVDFEGVMPNSGTTLIKFGSESATA